ncbi:MAG: hypothetical protein WCD47_13230 [Candidatus Sulfotelmatobacter sp.]
MLLSPALFGQTSGSSSATQAPAAETSSTKGFFARWADFYRRDWAGAASSSPAPARRGLPSPLDSPPFPNSDWSYGGSPVIGEPDTNSYPLMTAINGAENRTKLYGWIEPSLNYSTSLQTNAPEENDVYSNRLELDHTAPEYAAANYLQKELSVHDFLSFRSDFLDDKKGQRTGYATKYSENTIMWCHWIGSTVQLRPELRFERAWDRKLTTTANGKIS